MASVIFAAITATLAFLAFERTRAFGIIGVFILLALKPIWFSPLFGAVTLAYLYFKMKRK